MSYETLANLKLMIQKTDPADDAILQLILNSADKAINSFCNRSDGFVADAAASARYYPGSDEAYQWIDECTEITEVAVKDSPDNTTYTAWTTPTTNMAGDGDWFAFTGDPIEPDYNPIAEGKPYTALGIDPNGDYSYFVGQGGYVWPSDLVYEPRRRQKGKAPTVRVTAKWGYATTVPDDIRAACAMQAAIWYKRLQSSGASVLANPGVGTLEMFKTLDPMVEQVLKLGRYVKPAVGRS